MEAYLHTKYHALIGTQGFLDFTMRGYTESNPDAFKGESSVSLIRRVLPPFLQHLAWHHGNVDPAAVVDFMMMCSLLFELGAESNAFPGMTYEKIHHTWPPVMYSPYVNAGLTERGYDAIPLDEMPFYFKPASTSHYGCIYPATFDISTTLLECVERAACLQAIRRARAQPPSASNKRSHVDE